MTDNQPYQQVPPRAPSADDGVSIELFGNDHWVALLRVDDAVRDSDGLIDPNRLNIAYSKRSSFKPTMQYRGDYPTQVKASATVRGDGRYGVSKVKGHDDIDCLVDLERAGLIEPNLPHVEQDKFIDSTGAVVLDESGAPLSPYDLPESIEKEILGRTRWTVTEYGAQVVRELQAHKASGKTVHSFVAEQQHGEI